MILVVDPVKKKDDKRHKNLNHPHQHIGVYCCCGFIERGAVEKVNKNQPHDIKKQRNEDVPFYLHFREKMLQNEPYTKSSDEYHGGVENQKISG
jgi:hypothetical protein